MVHHTAGFQDRRDHDRRRYCREPSCNDEPAAAADITAAV
jgi:hypothetical protein